MTLLGMITWSIKTPGMPGFIYKKNNNKQTNILFSRKDNIPSTIINTYYL
jgi:hypothetical protein